MSTPISQFGITGGAMVCLVLALWRCRRRIVSMAATLPRPHRGSFPMDPQPSRLWADSTDAIGVGW